jgi:hypothetical protein
MKNKHKRSDLEKQLAQILFSQLARPKLNAHEILCGVITTSENSMYFWIQQYN